jgi:hypothetical protein
MTLPEAPAPPKTLLVKIKKGAEDRAVVAEMRLAEVEAELYTLRAAQGTAARLLQTARSAAQKRTIWEKSRPRVKRAGGLPAGWRTGRREKPAAICLAQRPGPRTEMPPGGPSPRGQSPRSLSDNNHDEGLFCDDSSLAFEVPSL